MLDSSALVEITKKYISMLFIIAWLVLFTVFNYLEEKDLYEEADIVVGTFVLSFFFGCFLFRVGQEIAQFIQNILTLGSQSFYH